MKTYRINEIFYSLQFEGARSGTSNIFIRFAGCNLMCSYCDTEFESFRELTLDDILKEIKQFSPCNSIILTGGEPGLSIDDDLILGLKKAGNYLAIETNGTISINKIMGVDWITCSPKVAEHVIKKSFPHGVDELKYVRSKGQGIPRPSIKASHYFISPAFNGDLLLKENLDHCVDLVLKNPDWKLTLQNHKFINLR